MTKEQLLHYKHTVRNPKKGLHDISKAFWKVKALIDKNVEEDYIREIFYARFLQFKPWATIGVECNNATADCVRKIIERYIKKTQNKGGEQNGFKNI